MLFQLSTKKIFKSTERAFSLLEVLVTAAIIGMVAGIIAVKYSSFNSVVLLRSQAYEIATDLREMQSFALSNRGEGSNFREDYGLYFDLAEPQQYIYFQDDGDLTEYGRNAAYYDSGEELQPTSLLDSRFKLNRICVNITSSDDLCPTEVSDISISFKRPNFDAQFSSVSGTGLINNARLELVSINDDSFIKTVVVNNTGEIDVE